MFEVDRSDNINYINSAKIFDVTSLVSAYIFNHKPDFVTGWEKYDFAQLILVMEGSGTYKTEDAEYPLEADMMFYRPAHKRSSYVLEGENVRYALISFVCDSPEIDDIGVIPVVLREEEMTALLDVIRTAVKICEPLKENEPQIGMRIKVNIPKVVHSFIYASLERFLCMVYCRLHNIELLMDETQKVNRYMDQSRLVVEVKAYLEENISEAPTLQDICSKFGVSQTALMKKFHKETNKGVMEYFTDLKMEAAKRRIQKTSESFTEIAESLGYSSVSYFSRVFKAKTGVTPTEYSRHASKRRASIEL